MAALSRKRDTPDELQLPVKRARVIKASHSIQFPQGQQANLKKAVAAEVFSEAEDEDDDYKGASVESSNEDDTVDTPVTPFSPTRKKFPSQLKTIKCTWGGCTKTFNRPARLEAHLRSHTGERPYACNFEGCDKTYRTDKHLQAHIKGSHTHERKYECDQEGCGKSFLTATRLKRHKEIHIGHERFRCAGYQPCNLTFRKHQTLQRHIRSDHLGLVPFPCTYINPVTLEACNAGFEGSIGLRKHQERVHGAAQFFCPQCIIQDAFYADGTPMHLGFTTDNQLQAHIRKEHADCPFCDLKCSSQRELQNHIDRDHSGQPVGERMRISCTYLGCDKKFTTAGNLKTHIRTAHMGERYICGTFDLSSHPDIGNFTSEDSCGKDFHSKANLIDHVRTAHLKLPSLINAKRKKYKKLATTTGDDDDDADSLELNNDESTGKKKPKRRSKKQLPSALEGLLGVDPRRTIPCAVLGCPRRFMRDYDLGVHMRSAHPSTHTRPTMVSSTIEEAFEYPEPECQDVPGFAGGPIQRAAEEMSGSYEDNLNWELEDYAADGSNFWFGDDELMPMNFGGNEDEWMQDEMEMRDLIDDT